MEETISKRELVVEAFEGQISRYRHLLERENKRIEDGGAEDFGDALLYRTAIWVLQQSLYNATIYM